MATASVDISPSSFFWSAGSAFFSPPSLPSSPFFFFAAFESGNRL